MPPVAPPLADIVSAGRRAARRVVDLSANRVELLVVEAQEARERLLQTFLFSLGVAVFALLAGITFTGAIVLLFWNYSPLIAMAALTVLYVGASIFLYMRLSRLRTEWQAFSDTLDQLRKDCECLASTLQ